MVGKWGDIRAFSAASHLIQSNAAQQPTWNQTAGPNSTPAIVFNGIDDFLNNTVNYGALSGGLWGNHVFAVAKYTGGANQRVITSQNTDWVMGWHSSNVNAYYAGGQWVGAQGGSTITDPYLFSATLDPVGPAYLYRNGTLANSNTTSNILYTPPNGLRLGSKNDATQWSAAVVSDISWYDRELYDNVRKAVENYINSRYALW